MMKHSHKIKWPNYQKIVPSGVANCRKLPFGGRATRDSRVRRLPRKENARVATNVYSRKMSEKPKKVWSTNFKCERFGSCIYARGRY